MRKNAQRDRVEPATIELRQRKPCSPILVHDPPRQCRSLGHGLYLDDADEALPRIERRAYGQLESRPSRIIGIR